MSVVFVNMSLKTVVYNSLPKRLKPLAQQGYRQITGVPSESELHTEFIDQFFDSREEYEQYVAEFNDEAISEIRDQALREYRKLTGGDSMGTIGLNTAQDYYALVRKEQPSRIVETGVCNGISTLSILLALRENGCGSLYSIDYPFRADESLEEFQAETFGNFAGEAIPSDKDPGWIIPDTLRKDWTLILGKSQRELPKHVREHGEMELFIHDSEHSHPCMMFEYELAYEWLEDTGVILSDDIGWNDAFSVFVDVREPIHGKISHNVGYVRKQSE